MFIVSKNRLLIGQKLTWQFESVRLNLTFLFIIYAQHPHSHTHLKTNIKKTTTLVHFHLYCIAEADFIPIIILIADLCRRDISLQKL